MKFKIGDLVRIVKLEATMLSHNHDIALEAMANRTVLRISRIESAASWPIILDRADGSRFPGGWRESELRLVRKPTIVIMP